jgi:L-gulonate 3-dehydrogenase
MPTVGLVGVGLIGRAWANVFSRAGWDVRCWDASPEATANAPKLVADSLHDLARLGLVAEPAAAAKRVRSAATMEECVSGVDFVQESGPETIDAKLDIWKRLDAAAAPETILVSSSSAIVASRFTEGLKGRNRCLIAHPVNPPHVVPIVELCPAPWTDPAVVKRARAIYESVGQVPMELKKEIDGFILNRMQAVLLSEAFRLVSEGYCTPEDLDKTIAHGLGLRWSFMGPFETIEMNALLRALLENHVRPCFPALLRRPVRTEERRAHHGRMGKVANRGGRGTQKPLARRAAGRARCIQKGTEALSRLKPGITPNGSRTNDRRHQHHAPPARPHARGLQQALAAPARHDDSGVAGDPILRAAPLPA